jgi:DNA polymerase III epsilon subunit-like protein
MPPKQNAKKQRVARRVVVWDTETTGLTGKSSAQQLAASPRAPRVIEIGAVICDYETMEQLETYHAIVYDPAIDYTLASEYHTVTADRAREEGVPIGEALDSLINLITDERVVKHITHNIDFDVKMISSELLRLHAKDSTDPCRADQLRRFLAKKSLCTAKAFCNAVKVPSTNGYSSYAYPSLDRLYTFATGKTDRLDRHTALGDSLAVCEILVNKRGDVAW